MTAVTAVTGVRVGVGLDRVARAVVPARRSLNCGGLCRSTSRRFSRALRCSCARRYDVALGGVRAHADVCMAAVDKTRRDCFFGRTFFFWFFACFGSRRTYWHVHTPTRSCSTRLRVGRHQCLLLLLLFCAILCVAARVVSTSTDHTGLGMCPVSCVCMYGVRVCVATNDKRQTWAASPIPVTQVCEPLLTTPPRRCWVPSTKTKTKTRTPCAPTPPSPRPRTASGAPRGTLRRHPRVATRPVSMAWCLRLRLCCASRPSCPWK